MLIAWDSLFKKVEFFMAIYANMVIYFFGMNHLSFVVMDLNLIELFFAERTSIPVSSPISNTIVAVFVFTAVYRGTSTSFWDFQTNGTLLFLHFAVVYVLLYNLSFRKLFHFANYVFLITQRLFQTSM